jgi:hypothetical protein
MPPLSTNTKVLPHPLERLNDYILDNHNCELHCENCNQQYTTDGSAFNRDTAGSGRDGKFYRHFRCKGKGKGICSQSYSHELFLQLATRQLGANTIEQIKHQIDFIQHSPQVTTTTKSSYITQPITKRPFDGQHTGFTPSTKRTSSVTSTKKSPPTYPPVFPDNRGTSPHNGYGDDSSFSYITESNNTTGPSSSNQSQYYGIPNNHKNELVSDLCTKLSNAKLLKLERAEMKIESLTDKLWNKEEMIALLQEKIAMLSTASIPTASHSQSVQIEQSSSPTIGSNTIHVESSKSTSPSVISTPELSPKPEIINAATDLISLSYSDVAKSNPLYPPIQSKKEPTNSVTPQKELQTKHNLILIYLIGMHQNKLGEFRRHAKEVGLSLIGVTNISFIGSSIMELLLDPTSSQSFIDKAKSLGFQVRLDIDITSKTKSNPILLEYPNSPDSISQLVKRQFITRISHEIKSTNNLQVREFYLDWASKLNWKESLLLPSTLSTLS